VGIRIDTVLPDSFLRAMPREERAKLGKAGITQEQAEAKFRAGKEKDLQRLIATYLRLNEFYYVTPRMDKRSTLRRGAPDFIICIHGHFLCIEAKACKGTLSDMQSLHLVEVTKCGGTYCVARSLEDVIQAIATISQAALRK
jgi:hypothetical protein